MAAFSRRGFEKACKNQLQQVRLLSRITCEPVMANPNATVELNCHKIIGFDMDHTLVRYRLPAVRKLVQQCLCSHLIENNEATPSLLDEVRAQDDLVMKGIVCDKKRGNLMKLDAAGKILVAYHGTTLLDESDILNIYGPDANFASVMSHLAEGVKSDHYFFFDNFFDSPAIPILATLIAKHDARGAKWTPGNQSTDYSHMWMPLFQAFTAAFQQQAFKAGTGGFFSALQADPGSYVRQLSSGSRRWLGHLRENGHKLFVLTSSHSDFAHFLLDYSYGPSWRQDFALVGVNARKPGFFARPAEERPFYVIDDHLELDECPVTDLKHGMVFGQGNCSGLNQFLSNLTDEPMPKVAYFGDSIRSDVVCLHKGNWDSVAIVEELFVEAPQNIPGQVRVQPCRNTSEPAQKRRKDEEVATGADVDVDADFAVLQSSAWGSLFSHGSAGCDTFCAKLLQDSAYACVPCLPEIPAANGTA